MCVPALVALGLGSGCGDPAGPPVATTITISPLEAILEDAGDTVQLTATVEDQNGQAMTDVAVAWSSSDSIIANVSEDGLVTGEEAGSVTIQAWVGMRTVSVPAFVEVDSGPRTVLHKLYRVMGGDDWRNNTSWRTDAPLDQWHGVWINDQGNIHQLWLRENGLTGAIPPEVGRLTSLELLHLGINRVTGSIPPELGLCHANLQHRNRLVCLTTIRVSLQICTSEQESIRSYRKCVDDYDRST